MEQMQCLPLGSTVPKTSALECRVATSAEIEDSVTSRHKTGKKIWEKWTGDMHEHVNGRFNCNGKKLETI